MSKTLTVRVSSDSLKRLDALCKSSGLKRGPALSWIVTETSIPSVPKRGKAKRTEPLSLPVSDSAQAMLDSIVESTEASVDVVIEAYLSRDYS